MLKKLIEKIFGSITEDPRNSRVIKITSPTISLVLELGKKLDAGDHTLLNAKIELVLQYYRSVKHCIDWHNYDPAHCNMVINTLKLMGNDRMTYKREGVQFAQMVNNIAKRSQHEVNVEDILEMAEDFGLQHQVEYI